MFYSQFILAKKGPLGTIWIAAHLERKLRKNQVADTDIGVSVDSILFPDVPIALRLSSHLLLGVVRIYSRKVNYLFDDCSEALLKIKQAFRSTAVDLPPEESTAPYHSITLPETFDLDDFELPDNDIFQGNYVDHHVSTREQITLQDTMEGVVYTTSQFGLDERFGDGDASQIGLDLDEVLLTDKADTLEHDDCSASPKLSHQKDEKKEIDELPTAAEVTDYAEGPSTPGLEEPNLYGTQMDQVNNGADYHNSKDFTSMKSTENSSAVCQRENDVIDCSLPNNVKQFGLDSVMVELDGKREEQEHLACTTTDQESLIPNDHCSASVAKCTTGIISASDIPEKVEDLHDEVLMNNEPTVSPLDQTVKDGVASLGVSINEVATPGFSQVASDQEDFSCKVLSYTDGSRGPESDGHLENGATLSKNEVLNGHEISKSEGESGPFDEAKKSIVTSSVGSPGRQQAVGEEAQVSEVLMEAEALNHDSHGAVEHTESILRPCTSHLNQPSLPSVEGEKYLETDASDPALRYQETMEPSICKGNLDFGESDVQGGSQIFSDRAESINKSAVSEMPEPEKLLSLPYQHDSEANDLLMESTPDNQGISDGQTAAARVKGMSGKKRSFTESTLTMQSVDFVESYGGAQSKRTAASIPDDDDLLSSILVGRRSSVLKVKPSPAAPELASTKRFRSGPGSRTSAVKRKVLMDDMMVLQGDTIRQQLTNTEDIRRLRKKAPCTQHEIAVIQRQFLEDEIFHESIFTGLSADLTLLRNETFDLTGIKVFDDGSDSSFIEKTNTEVHEVERNMESMAVQPQGVEEVQPTEISLLSESHQSEINLGSHDTDAFGHSNIVSLVKDVDSSLNAEMNDAGGNIEVFEADGLGHETSSLTNVENSLCIPNEHVAPLPLMDKANDPFGSVHTDTSSIPSDQNLNTSPILEDKIVEDKGDRSEAGAIENEEHSLENRTEVHILESNDLHAYLATGSKGSDEYTDNQISFNGDLPMQENGSSMAVSLNEGQIVASGLGCDDRSGCMFGEDAKVDCAESLPPGLDEKESYLNDEENPICQEAGIQSAVFPEISDIRSPSAGHNDENDMIADDTGFLNVGDDEIIDDDDDFVPEGANLENSGWSSRTRAVAKYLQTLFEKDDLNGRQNLHLDNILAGKTRKEASRMFFETLVLKTRDYVHVDQPKPFASIYLKPRMKLMKSDF